MGGAAVAEPGTFGDQEVELPLPGPGKGFFDIADEKMVGTESSGEPGSYRDIAGGVGFFILGRKAVEFHHTDCEALAPEFFDCPDNDTGFA
jgi:hypothetical protein